MPKSLRPSVIAPLQSVLFAACLNLSFLGHASANSDWVSIANSSLQVEVGTALDLSHLSRVRDPSDNRRVTVPVGSESFALGGQPDPNQRYFCATMGFGSNTGGLPPVGEAADWAKAVRRGGYNAVRFHMMDLVLMEGRYRDFDFDPVQLERFDHLVAALRAEGISFVFDVMGSWNGAYGDVGKNRWVEGVHNTKAGTYFTGADRVHFIKLVDLLWNRRNPLTGMAPLADPATIGLILVNESEVDFITRNGIVRQFVEPFHAWLIARYGSEANITAAWGSTFTAANLERIDEIDSARTDFQLFATEIQIARVAWMRQVLKERGYDGPITDFNAEPGIHSAVSRRSLSFVDMHGYADTPSNGGMIEPGTALLSARWPVDLLAGKSRYFDRLSWARLEGKPFTVSEYGMSFWNAHRYAIAPMTAAYARLQDWKMICHYGTPISMARPGPGAWGQMIVPFNVGQDPALRAGEVIGAFLFGRGDVTSSDARVVLQVPSDIAAAASATKIIDWASAKLQYLVSVGTSLEDDAAVEGSRRIVIPWKEYGHQLGSLVERLRTSGVELRGTDVRSGILRSSTGELTLNTAEGIFSVETQGTIGLVATTPAQVDWVGWKLSLIKGEAAVFLSDLGHGQLARSERALLIIATDARNTGMKFADRRETIINEVGRFPVQVRDAVVHVEFEPGSASPEWRLFALDFTGRRTRELSIVRNEDGRLLADIQLSSLGENATTFFEFVRGAN